MYMVDINSTIWVISLDVSDLKHQMKDEDWHNGSKNKIQQEIDFKY